MALRNSVVCAVFRHGESLLESYGVCTAILSSSAHVDLCQGIRITSGRGFAAPKCQSASKFDPRSASNFDPLCRRVLAVVLAPSELVGVAETARELVGV